MDDRGTDALGAAGPPPAKRRSTDHRSSEQRLRRVLPRRSREQPTVPVEPWHVPSLSSHQIARTIGSACFFGAVLAIAWGLIPRPGSHALDAVLGLALAMLVLGAVLLSGATDRLPVWTMHVVIAVSQLVITIGFVVAQDPTGDLRWFYVWGAPLATIFVRRRTAGLHLAWSSALLTAALVVLGAPLAVGASVWLMTLGTVAAATALAWWISRGMRATEEESLYAAMHDPLTGLPNRQYFAHATAQALTRRQQDGGEVHVLLIDLDAFKLVNDTYGHTAGDELLCVFAQRLSSQVRSRDTVARLGGDEFAIVYDDPTGKLDPTAAVRRLEHTWTAPFDLPDGTVYTTGSVGITTATDDCADADSLLREADAAMYRAKATGRGGYAVFDEGMRDHAASRLQLDRALREALGLGQMWVAYQPVVDLASGRVTGVEALLRWNHPQLGPVSPAEFIPVAEENGLIVEIGTWVLDQACSQLSAWRAAGLVDRDFSVAVNVSARQVTPTLAEVVRETRARHGIDDHALVLELTESILLDDAPEPTAVLNELQMANVRLHLDDFGTGYSALSYLSRIPLAALKIDQSFVADLTVSPSRSAVVTAIVSMAHALDLRVVAEGVETREQALRLRQLGCEHAQGYLLGRPSRPEQLVDALAAAGPCDALSLR
ncbi:MAG TPA: EAL domain-containing protein [Actinomycetales bacterium]|nr:EAL domain-containing protein [Actinomycetales bacterium]